MGFQALKSQPSGILLLSFLAHAACSPLSYDPSIVSACTEWYDNDGSLPCSLIPVAYGITTEQFFAWNPSLGNDCSGFQTGHSYCVKATTSPPASTSSLPPSTTTTQPPTTTTKPGNGITTPTPTQPNMVDNCDKFYFTTAGDNCNAIAAQQGITLTQLQTWNPSVGSTCSGLWANAYLCVSVVGHDNTPPSGIQTPQPIQPGMVSNCDAFAFVQAGDNCASISAKNGITLNQFLEWNPQVGASCGGLWANVHVCVSVVGHTPSPTQPGNGIATPTPTQAGMTANCKKFHFVKQSQNCITIANLYSIPVANFLNWNPAAKSDCTGLWSNTYACVGVL